MTPERLGKYQILEQIGRGAMGEVYRAHDATLGRNVAIKTMIPKVGTDPELRRRFQREAQSAARLNHPNIVTVYDLVEDQGQSYIAMELLEGIDLREAIARRTLTGLDEKLSVMEQVADALAFAHARDVIHRDVKPANIHILSGGQVKLMDFGLARLGASEMTATGMVLGTPHYMSPEQVRGEKADARSDIFSTGAVFYELLCNRKAFDADSLHAILFRVLEYQPESIRKWVPEIPDAVVAIVERCLAKDPARRYANGAELGDALRVLRGALDPGNQTASGSVSAPSWASSRMRPVSSVRGSGSAALSAARRPPSSVRTAPPPQLPNVGATQLIGRAAVPARRRSKAPLVLVGIAAAVLVGASGSWYLFMSAPRSDVRDDHSGSPSPPSGHEPVVAGPLPSPAVSVTQVASAPAPAARRVAEPYDPSSAPPTERTSSVPRDQQRERVAQELERNRAAARPGATRVADLRSIEPVGTPPPTFIAPSDPEPPRTPPVVASPAVPTVAPTAPPAAATPVPAPAPVDQEPLVRQAIADYARAIESKDISLFRSVMPGLSTADEQSLRAAFAGKQRQSVTIVVDSVQIRGASATVRLTRRDTIESHTVTSQQTMTLAKNAGSWVITHIGK